MARVRSTLRIKQLHDTVHEQSKRLAGQADELAQWNTHAPATRERSAGGNRAYKPVEDDSCHRKSLSSFCLPGVNSYWKAIAGEITAVYCDLRGFTGFAEIAEPEEVISVLRQYHETLGRLIHQVRRLR